MANLVFEHPTCQKNQGTFGFFFGFFEKNTFGNFRVLTIKINF